MTGTYFATVGAGLAVSYPLQNSVDVRISSPADHARIRIREMMEDGDVKALPLKVWQATQAFATEIVRSFPFGPSTAMAIFGDSDEQVGEITFVDRVARFEMQLTIGGNGRAEAWMRSDTEVVRRADLTPHHVALLAPLLSSPR